MAELRHPFISRQAQRARREAERELAAAKARAPGVGFASRMEVEHVRRGGSLYDMGLGFRVGFYPLPYPPPDLSLEEKINVDVRSLSDALGDRLLEQLRVRIERLFLRS